MMLGLLSSKKLLLLSALALSIALFILPAIPAEQRNLNADNLWALHLTVELISIFVSVSVVAILFQRMDSATTKSSENSGNAVVFGFTAIALLDYMHALSYPGMPMFLTESSPEKTLFFWLCARIIELLTISAIAFQLQLKGNKRLWLIAATLFSAVIFYFSLYHLGRLPTTFDPLTGITAIKTNMEYGFFAGYIALTVFFWLKFKRNGRSQHFYFAGASFSMAMCALTLTNYINFSDVVLLIGHLFKILSAMFIYAAIYWTEIKRPYQLANIANDNLHKKDVELNTILENIPLGIIRLDRSLTFLYANTFVRNLSHIFKIDPVDQSLSAIFPAEISDLWHQHCAKAFAGEKIEFYYEYNYADNVTVYREVIVVPEKNLAGQTQSILCLVVDATEKEHAKRKELSALRETEKLRKALDEHAIVAHTDTKGIITSVNNKFSEISQYSRQELVGSTHQLINSKYHPQSFFKTMWQTISRGNIWHGEICNRAKDGSFYWVNTTIVPFLDARGKPEQYIAIRADITERKLAEQEALRLAYYDELTSLPNRRLLKEKLERSLGSDSSVNNHIHALLLIDLDNFKDVNDSLGHAMGDELLKQVAMRLQRSIHSAQTIARLGGDEFVVLISEQAKTKQQASINAGEQAENIRMVLSAPYTLDGETVTITPSIGVAILNQADNDASEFLKQADIAMYQSKALGRNKVTFFDPELQSAINTRNEILRELAQAISQNEFLLYYQPIYNQNKIIIGAEALIRWNSRRLGMIAPDKFIPLAEQTNHILAIGNWVLHTVCQQLQQWTTDARRSHWTIAVNVSAKQIQQPEFVNSVIAALTAHNAPAHRLKLEITESMLQVNVDETIAAMKQLRELGVRFSLDDFGTGYSSLNYLTKLPIDTLKIDRSFVDSMINSADDAVVVNTILSLAASLKLDVVAEGVETAEQMAFLLASGCQNFQGYLLSKPLPLAQLLLLNEEPIPSGLAT